MGEFLVYAVAGPVMIGIAAFYAILLARCVRRFCRWVFIREYVMTSDTIIGMVGWWKIYAKEKFSPRDVVHWSPEGDTQDDGEWWKKN